MPKIKIGFVFFRDPWLGGQNYYYNLFYAIKHSEKSQTEVVCIISKSCSERFISKMREVARIVYLPKYNKICVAMRQVFYFNNKFLNQIIIEHDIKLLSHFNLSSKGLLIPTVGWIPDFQHRRMPEFFSFIQLKYRDHWFYNMAKASKIIILSSLDAKNDFVKMMPDLIYKTRVLNFVSQVQFNDIDDIIWQKYKTKFQIRDNFFYIPNQFWAHKNHIVVIKALNILKNKGIDYQVICTGNIEDSRHPKYFNQLCNLIAEYKLESNFCILGLVPFEMVNGLMQKAVALINPSLFEGWSTTVEEAKSMQIKLILSDIPVHREQNPREGVYFNPLDSEHLAEQMMLVMQAEKTNFTGNQNDLKVRTEKFVLDFDKIILSAIA